MKKIWLLLCFVSVCSFGQTNQDYKNTLKTMFEVSGAEDSYQAVIKQMFILFKKQYPDLESTMWDELEKEFANTSIDDLTEMLVPVYAKYMTMEDLQDIIKFYETPAGIKFAKNTPFIMQESMQIGEKWGSKIGKDFEEKMRERGY